MPDAARAVSGIPRTDPGGRVTLRFWHRLNRFRHFCGGSLALASLDRACRNLVPAFPQRSLPRLLTAAACGGLRSTPDCRPRRALLHLSYSYAAPCGPALLVTQDPIRKSCANGLPGKPLIQSLSDKAFRKRWHSMAEERVQRRLAAILAADVVGYSRLMEQDEAGTLAALKTRRREILGPLVTQHRGR